MTTTERFWAKVNKNGPVPSHAPQLGNCWLWKAGRFTKRGQHYGAFLIGRSNHVASRVAWEFTFGVITEGLFVCHKCDITLCVNPNHLFLGTAADNMQDASAKGRLHNQFSNLTHCIRGHLLTGKNVRFRFRSGHGKACRVCRECKRTERQRIAANKARSL